MNTARKRFRGHCAVSVDQHLTQPSSGRLLFFQHIVMNTETHNWIILAVRDSGALSPCLCEKRGNLILNSSYTDYDFCNTICKEV